MKRFLTTGSAIGVLLPPILALAHLTLAYALVESACAQERVWLLHGVALLFLAAALLATRWAWRGTRSGTHADGSVSRARSFTWVGSYTGILFSAVIVAQWLTVWVLSPCVR